ncbi:aldehyde dehydrogenase family protein [[Clostridium] polysaccharolyticum]|uniref:Aldehyde dehydrogenase n=1 Tax=[Clostridium] polysaccharolyticum TaxID=29364 RepID=A0A1I0C998_9FIRM|nr:aldehyde dehydrogenase family protein [[Clostridium] polysaccharolyticum]SET15434.1 aldehyde dehydrogenase (NAD+) [[Clostridium] polysaccharolyticum]
MEKRNQGLFEMQKAYFQSGKTKTAEWRIAQLKKLKQMVKEHEAEFMESIYKDFGKSNFEQFATEIGQFYEEVTLFLKKMKKWLKPEKQPMTMAFFPSRGKIIRDPYGVVLLIAPFNYPLGLTFMPLVGAIAGGNCAMIKPSEHTMHFSKLLNQLIGEYFEAGFLSVCDPSGGKDTVDELLTYQFDYIFFTGSTTVGKIIMERAAKNLIPVTLELGGKSPCIVTEHANIKQIVKRISWGKILNAGQTCVAPDYVWVHESIQEHFLEELKREMEQQYNTIAKENEHYCKIINEASLKRLNSYIEEGNVYWGGKCDFQTRCLQPAILTDVNFQMDVMKEEIFGPVLPVLAYQKLDSVIEHMHRNPNPLALYVFTENKEEAQYLIQNIPSGGAVINDVIIHAGVPKYPFGGVGESGVGMYHGIYSLDTFTHRRTVIERMTFTELPFRFAPYTDRKMKFFRKYFR